MKGETSYYKILGVNENASNHELRKAFCKLSIELHPDTTSLEIDVAKSKFQEVLEAYEHLNNSNLRKIYDDKLKENSRSKNNNNVLNNLVIDSNNQNLIGNRRPFFEWRIVFVVSFNYHNFYMFNLFNFYCFFYWKRIRDNTALAN